MHWGFMKGYIMYILKFPILISSDITLDFITDYFYFNDLYIKSIFHSKHNYHVLIIIYDRMSYDDEL